MQTQNYVNDAFMKACQRNDIATVRYLCTSPDMSFYPQQYWKNQSLSIVAQHEDKTLLHYLIESPELEEHADWSKESSNILYDLLISGCLKDAEYIIQSSSLGPNTQISEDRLRYLSNHGMKYQYIDIVYFVIEHFSLPQDHIMSLWQDAYHYLDNSEIQEFCIFILERYVVDFEETDINIAWVMKNQIVNLLYAMMETLKKTDYFQYVAHFPQVEAFLLTHGYNDALKQLQHLPHDNHEEIHLSL